MKIPAQILFLFHLSAALLLSGFQLHAQCGACEYESENLVANGDFSAGNTGFNTDYTLATVNGPWGLLSYEGQYVVDNNANDVHQFFQGFDHTNPPSGQYLIVNGSSIANTNVWCQTITVEPDTWYSFSAWVRNVDTNPGNTVYAELQFNINGTPLGTPETVSGGWQEFAVDWFSDDFASIDICLVNQQTNGGGNDFGVDDISFTTCLPYEIVNIPDAGPDVTICSGETIELGTPAQNNFSYLWTGVGLSDDQVAQPTVTLSNDTDTPENYIFTLETDSADVGCLFTDQVEITVNPNPEPDFGEDLTICEGETTTLDAGEQWDSVSWNTNENTNAITIDQPGTYTATVTVSGCEGSDSWTVNTPDLPNIWLGPDTSICEDQSFTFNVASAGEWMDGTSENELTTNTEGWVWFEVEEMGCTSRDSVFLSVLNYPELDLPDSLFLCPGEVDTLYVSQPGFWSNGSVADSLLISEEGLYSVLLANQQCTVSDEVIAMELGLPEVELGEDQILCKRDVVDLNAFGAYNDSILWEDGSNAPMREIRETGLYQVLVWNQCGSDQDEVELIFNDCDYGIYVPNAFTPDGDGLNETWCPIALNIANWEVMVFDRWGDLVWITEKIGDCWIGNQQLGDYYVPNDVYVYKIVAESIQGEIIQKEGTISILR